MQACSGLGHALGATAWCGPGRADPSTPESVTCPPGLTREPPQWVGCHNTRSADFGVEEAQGLWPRVTFLFLFLLLPLLCFPPLFLHLLLYLLHLLHLLLLSPSDQEIYSGSDQIPSRENRRCKYTEACPSPGCFVALDLRPQMCTHWISSQRLPPKPTCTHVGHVGQPSLRLRSTHLQRARQQGQVCAGDTADHVLDNRMLAGRSIRPFGSPA